MYRFVLNSYYFSDIKCGSVREIIKTTFSHCVFILIFHSPQFKISYEKLKCTQFLFTSEYIFKMTYSIKIT